MMWHSNRWNVGVGTRISDCWRWKPLNVERCLVLQWNFMFLGTWLWESQAHTLAWVSILSQHKEVTNSVVNLMMTKQGRQGHQQVSHPVEACRQHHQYSLHQISFPSLPSPSKRIAKFSLLGEVGFQRVQFLAYPYSQHQQFALH